MLCSKFGSGGGFFGEDKNVKKNKKYSTHYETWDKTQLILKPGELKVDQWKKKAFHSMDQHFEVFVQS